MHRVQRGDTLYSIAFRNGIDYRELANWNGIGPPYTIYVGQELHLTPVSGAKGSVATRDPTNSHAPAQTVPRPGSFETVPSRTGATPVGRQPPAPTRAPDPVPVAAPVPAATQPTPAPSAPTGAVVWRWPASGQVVGTYSAGDPTRQGIDIAGKSGDPVRAAADGSVVYSGNGLIGYGELIIVKHSATYLSAYGHNSKRLVKEGDTVRAGQVIAQMGSSSATRDSLHFEIRKNGKPVNPLDFLPPR